MSNAGDTPAAAEPPIAELCVVLNILRVASCDVLRGSQTVAGHLACSPPRLGDAVDDARRACVRMERAVTDIRRVLA